MYTMFKKLHPFYFCNNFVGQDSGADLDIFGSNVAKEICDMLNLSYLLLNLIVRMSYS